MESFLKYGLVACACVLYFIIFLLLIVSCIVLGEFTYDVIFSNACVSTLSLDGGMKF